MRILTNPISNIPKLKNSHVLGWSLVWADQLDAAIDHACSPNIANASTVYIEHGVNFGGTLTYLVVQLKRSLIGSIELLHILM